MARVIWHTPEGGEKVEVGKVAILAKLLFINGAKRRRVADLQGPPERGDQGQVILRFGPQDWYDVSFPCGKQSDEFAQAAFSATFRRHTSTGGFNADASKPKSEAMRAALLAAARQVSTELDDSHVATGAAKEPEGPVVTAPTAMPQVSKPERRDTCSEDGEEPQQAAPTSSASKQTKSVDKSTGADGSVKPATVSVPIAEPQVAQVAHTWQHVEQAVRAAIAQMANPAFDSCSVQFIDPLPEQQPGTGLEMHGFASEAARARRLVNDLCAAWQAADTKRCEQHRHSLEWLRRQLDESCHARQQAECESRDVDGQLRKAEVSIAALEKTKKFQEEEITAFKKLLQENKRSDPSRLRFLEQEVAALREQLRETWESPPKRAKRSNPKSPPCRARPPTPPGNDTGWSGNAVAIGIAQSEAAPLLQCPPQERHLLRKRLLLKWHPDKQPSVEHSLLAKRVMQEMQNLAAWNA